MTTPGWGASGPVRSFGPNPEGYDPHYHFKLGIEAGLNAYAAPLGFLADQFLIDELVKGGLPHCERLHLRLDLGQLADEIRLGLGVIAEHLGDLVGLCSAADKLLAVIAHARLELIR